MKTILAVTTASVLLSLAAVPVALAAVATTTTTTIANNYSYGVGGLRQMSLGELIVLTSIFNDQPSTAGIVAAMSAAKTTPTGTLGTQSMQNQTNTSTSTTTPSEQTQTTDGGATPPSSSSSSSSTMTTPGSTSNLLPLLMMGNQSSYNNLEELLVLDRLFNPPVGAGGVVGATAGGATVVVERGDTLSGIAQQFLGSASRYPEIAALNNITNPNRIYPGQVLQLPGTTAAVVTTPGIPGVGGAAVVGTPGIGGFGTTPGRTTLGELIVLEHLFPVGGIGGLGGLGGIGGGDNVDDLARLLLLDRYFWW